ncbi:hypothetical protein A0256_23700 [Mucilaginibacter sp. PAMC 26640]|nr:hypothetical protein A0256_23700 [Mucilaginibacter sp. PAMC 26640]
MKNLVIGAFVALLTCKALAQVYKVVDARKSNIPTGKWISVEDSVFGYKATSDAMMVFLGGAYPNQRLTVILKEDAMASPEFFHKKVVVVSGIVKKRDGQAKMMLTDKQFLWVKRSDTSRAHRGRGEIYDVFPGRPPITAREAMKLVGRTVLIRDTVYYYKAISSSLGLLYIGSKVRNNALMIVLKNMYPTTNLGSLLGINFDFYGKVILYKRRPAIILPDWGYKYSL